MNREEGTTVLLTTHDMDDVESLCGRLMLIGHGKKLMDGTVDDLRALAGAKRILKATLGSTQPLTLPHDAALRLREGNRIEVEFDPKKLHTDELVLHLAKEAGLQDMQVQDIPLDETVAALYRGMQA